jgi:hypothetical protein
MLHEDTPSESGVQRLAQWRGLRVTKSASGFSWDNDGEYCLVDERNVCVLGAHYGATLDEVVDYLQKLEPGGGGGRR